MINENINLLNCIKNKASDTGLTIREIEKRANLGKNTISSWKNKNPSFEKVIKVCNVLNCGIDDLLNGDTFYIGDLNDNNKKVIKEISKILKEGQDDKILKGWKKNVSRYC